VADQSKEVGERAGCPEWIMAVSKYYYLTEKSEILHQIVLVRCARTRAGEGKPAGQKKARYGSGLNLSLEENRGDICMMLHRKTEIQFIFVMTVIDMLDSTASWL
jgi:hypothetical protein